MSRATSPVIEVFADIWCPFAHVGLRAIEEQRARAGRRDVAIWVRAWPLELVNGAPLDPAVTKEHADDLRDEVAPSAPRTGMPSGIMGKLAATNIAAMIKDGDAVQARSASMADLAAACVALPDRACDTGARRR